ncbi:SDR family NAD(P)-dependent oxidoreductase [Kistimonas asteriae]|uniref:SDR family NAD(P)-dependent oxidoreductase n=1 Tax=Kistimonas asteriae TaxID=517724 RepID=UPI001BACF23D|nr:SDR family NAD(P)-dependent oxidoreductase [Kistimonas asteriae]
MELTNKTIIIIGASSGIGKQVARLLSHRNNNIVVLARRENLLTSLAEEITRNGSQCLPIAADALSAEAMEAAVQLTVETFGTIDVALINVGDGPSFDMASATAEPVLHNMAINYSTLVYGLLPLIAVMKQQKQGLIAHTNSLAGFLGLPRQGPYSAAKAAGRILIDTCRIELAPWNIKFLSLYPGFVATERVSDDGIPSLFEISETAAAKHMVHAMEKEKHDYLFPFSLRWLIRLARILPKSVVARMTQKMMND